MLLSRASVLAAAPWTPVEDTAKQLGAAPDLICRPLHPGELPADKVAHVGKSKLREVDKRLWGGRAEAHKSDEGKR